MRTLVVGAAIVDLMMKIDRLPKSGEDIPCRETKTVDRKSTRLNSSHNRASRMPSSA